ncbi:hypothetical protein, partial [Butyricicoccus porcorum]|uniref:hypothetical protein n=1 Tax=Butyricicoccus porcorum TaxID=1945634 RepID=UPI00196A20B4
CNYLQAVLSTDNTAGLEDAKPKRLVAAYCCVILILSILVDTFISKMSIHTLPASVIHSISAA